MIFPIAKSSSIETFVYDGVPTGIGQPRAPLVAAIKHDPIIKL
jgi:hypothetical protein